MKRIVRLFVSTFRSYMHIELRALFGENLHSIRCVKGDTGRAEPVRRAEEVITIDKHLLERSTSIGVVSSMLLPRLHGLATCRMVVHSSFKLEVFMLRHMSTGVRWLAI
jgi:hypothetical protein